MDTVAEIVTAHLHVARNVARRLAKLVPYANPDDIYSASLAGLFKGASSDTIDQTRDYEGYLATACANAVRDYARRERTRQRRERQHALGDSGDAYDPEFRPAPLAADRTDDFWAAVQTCPDITQEMWRVLKLSYWDDWADREIAAVTGRSRLSVFRLRQKALGLLRAWVLKNVA